MTVLLVFWAVPPFPSSARRVKRTVSRSPTALRPMVGENTRARRAVVTFAGVPVRVWTTLGGVPVAAKVTPGTASGPCASVPPPARGALVEGTSPLRRTVTVTGCVPPASGSVTVMVANGRAV